MAVYVDDMRASFGRMKMCHMIADSSEELLAMADRIGVARKWIQDAGTPREHFDISPALGSKRTKPFCCLLAALICLASLAFGSGDARAERTLFDLDARGSIALWPIHETSPILTLQIELICKLRKPARSIRWGPISNETEHCHAHDVTRVFASIYTEMSAHEFRFIRKNSNSNRPGFSALNFLNLVQPPENIRVRRPLKKSHSYDPSILRGVPSVILDRDNQFKARNLARKFHHINFRTIDGKPGSQIGIESLSRQAHLLSSGSESMSDKGKTTEGDNGSRKRYQQHPIGPGRHVLLGFQIIISVALILVSAGFLYHASKPVQLARDVDTSVQYYTAGMCGVIVGGVGALLGLAMLVLRNF